MPEAAGGQVRPSFPPTLVGVWVDLCHSSASSLFLKTKCSLVTAHRAGLAAPWVIWPHGLVSLSQNSSPGDGVVPG